jgi:steroid 5-alpha reductase family enzyme
MNDTMFGYWVTTLGVFLVTVCTLIAVWTLAETVSMTALLVRLRGERTIRPGDYGLRRFRYVSA